MVELFLAALAIPEVRAEIEKIALLIFEDIWFKRTNDPVFASHFNAIMEQRRNARSEQEKDDALLALNELLKPFVVRTLPSAAEH